jgi:predicted metalloprotease with PDZ domain
MKLVIAGVALALMASVAGAQDDKEAVKKRILDAVEKKLKAEEERILKEISKIIDDELAKAKGVKPSGHEPKPEPKPEVKPEPKPEPKPETKPKARGYLGVQVGELAPEDLDALGIKGGVRVTGVPEDGPAAKAGVEEEDVILEIDGEAITGFQALAALVQKKGAGTVVTAKVLRGKEKKDLKITLGRNPNDPAPKEEPKKEEPKKEEPKKEEPKKEEPQAQPKGEGDLRERIKKFLDKQGEQKKDEPKAAEDEGGLAIEDSTVEKMRPLLEQLGADVETFLEKGKDGKWRIRADYREMFKGLDPSELFKKMIGGAEEAKKEEAKKPEPKPEPKKAAAPWLGVMPEELTDETRAQLDIEDGVGLAVSETRPGSPAEKSLQKGDIIVKIDGKALKGEEGLKKFMATAKVGQAIELTILRKGKSQTVKLTLAERKD